MTVDVVTPIGVLPITIPSVKPDLLFGMGPMSNRSEFRPPSIFSAPLPVGSGARALGFGGSFSAIADDATAASWNPAGLTQLERPEISFVYRYSETRNRHDSDLDSFEAETSRYQSDGLNYMSLAYPFFINPLRTPIVVSLNYQEAYDFRHIFTARLRERSDTDISEFTTDFRFDRETVHRESATRPRFEDLEVRTTTRFSSTLLQTVINDLVADLDFEQQGVIEAMSPAIALELHPRFSVGGTVNVYRDSELPGKSIRSRSIARFVSTDTSRATIMSERVVNTEVEGTTTFTIPKLPDVSFTFPFKNSLPEITDTQETNSIQQIVVEGTVDELNEFNDLSGWNATAGFLWHLSPLITFAGVVDLPWTAEAEQTKTIRTQTVVLNQSGSDILDETSSSSQERKDVEFEFPLFWRLGTVFHWHPFFYTSVDIARTHWSDFSFRAKGEEKINPLDGSPHSEQALDDTWTVNVGTEVLWIFRDRNVIAFRGGLVWEQRPAIGTPDDYYGFSLGTGYTLGEDANSLTIDLAYSYLAADDVQTVVPAEQSLSTDTEQHQFFASVIWHF